MTTYRVPIDKVATNYCYAYVEVEADDPEAAKEVALAKAQAEDDIEWEFNDVLHASYEAEEPSVVGSAPDPDQLNFVWRE